MSDLFITNTKDRPCISPPVCKPPPLYKPIKNRLRKYISPGLIVGGLRNIAFKLRMRRQGRTVIIREYILYYKQRKQAAVRWIRK